MELPQEVIEKLWNNVEKTDSCWNWKGALDKDGYPIIDKRFPGRKVRYNLRRVSAQLAGRVVSDHIKIKSFCENRLCVNPQHLICGDEDRFWRNVHKLSEDKGGCWWWTGELNSEGYGDFNIESRHIKAHRYSYFLHTGRPVPQSLFLCHTCDVKYCVNPAHLFLGTAQDNNKDKLEKGRQSRGETHGNSKFTEEKVKEIRALHSNGMSIRKLAKQFSVETSTISRILSRELWKHVP